MWIAAHNGHLEVVKTLMAAGAEIDHQNKVRVWREFMVKRVDDSLVESCFQSSYQVGQGSDGLRSQEWPPEQGTSLEGIHGEASRMDRLCMVLLKMVIGGRSRQ